MEFLVQSDGWELVVGQRTAGAAGVAEVPLRSGVLEVDPLAPMPVLALHLPDHELVADLFGAPAAERVAAGADLIEAEPTERLMELHRLGQLLWLRGCGALPLDRGLLDAELAVFVAQCEPLLDPDWEPSPQLVELAEAFVTAAAWLRNSPDNGDPALAELVGQALAYIPSTSGDPHHDDLIHERELWEAADRWPETRVWSEMETEIKNLRIPHAVHLGRTDHVHTDSLDWNRVPDTWLPADEDSVAYAISGTTRLITVTVTNPGQAPPAPPVLTRIPDHNSVAVLASLYCPPLPVPLARQTLTQSDGGGWSADLPLTTDAAALITGPLLLDVHAAHLTSPPLMGIRRQAAQATRWSARAAAFARVRGASLSGEPPEHSRAAARFAARLWRRLAADDRAPSKLLASARADQCHRLATTGLREPWLSIAERWLRHV